MLRGAGEGRLLVLNNQSSISRLVALKPRQVLLAEQQKRLKMPKTTVLEDGHKLALLHSVVKYMSNKGFKKSLKKFIKEAQVEDGAWEENSFDLEEIYCKYLENCKNGNTNTKDLREPEKSAEGTMLKDAGDKGASLDAVNKKKMKKHDKNGDITKSFVSEVISDNAVEELKEKKKKKKKKNAAGDEEAPVEDDGKNTNNTNEENNKDDVTELTSKKKKKKNKLTSESCEENGTNEVSLPAVSEKQVVPKEVADVAEITADQNNSEPKEKKKKKKVSGKPLDNGVELVNKEQSQDDLGNRTDEKSKKRKRSTSDESEDKQVEGVVTEDSKRRKTEAVNAQQTEVKIVGGESKVDFKSPNPSDEKKTVKKQQNGSIEPKTVNAFQRVKVDAVKFADERLTDNSYWAKDGAETGYGAKAQEILGQVKGRDFRHEKTKKKRGSYRGGQIDLQSHSVKFNYSDEE